MSTFSGTKIGERPMQTIDEICDAIGASLGGGKSMITKDDALLWKMADTRLDHSSLGELEAMRQVLAVCRKAILAEAAQIATNEFATWNNTGYGRSVSSRIAERFRSLAEQGAHAMSDDAFARLVERNLREATTNPDHKPDGSGLDDGPWLPGQAPRKKPQHKPASEISEIRNRAWKTRRQKYGDMGHR